ncbi:acyl-CoA dehydrogenase family protein [Mycolicibacterium mengxianglii]|uniref:acyl-CoA dehydrogenase family protein n=1 Tax=Mycolicibacterium mengxianglii TaxID=2736649 RepID=UPI0018EF2DA9|nr:acyl-CoA dehydrogenase family protein [Mycolicibacterium mengxianglii]
MSTDFADLHDELRSVAVELLEKETGATVPVSLLARAGWTGLEVPDHLGGAGATFCETAVICEEIGRAAASTGYFGGLLAVGALTALPPGAVRDGLLSGIAEGTSTVSVALSADGNGGTALPFGITPASAGWRAAGRARFVVDATADQVLLLAEDPAGFPVIVVVPADTAGLTVQPQPVVDETRSLAEVLADDVTVGAAAVLRFADDGHAPVRALTARAETAIACDSLGIAEAMLARTVAYVGVREQFGRPIGSFQAVKHACADMLVLISVGQQLVRSAVDGVAEQRDDAGLAASKAKAYTTEAAVEIAGRAMQLHGGIGYTWESGVHGYLKRATLNRALFGSPATHRRRIAQQYRV